MLHTRQLMWMGTFVCLITGCSLAARKTHWYTPTYAEPDADAISNWRLVGAEDSYLAAVSLESQGRPDCVEAYLKTAGSSWTSLEHEFATNGQPSPRTLDLYQSSVSKVIVTGQRFGRWQPEQGLVIATSSGTMVLPMAFHGFHWSPDQFQRLQPVGEYATPGLTRAYKSEGLGVPIVAERHVVNPQPFTQQQQSFAATALVRYCQEVDSYQLEFFDPLRESCVHVGSCSAPLARDLSAPLAYENLDDDRQWLSDFLQPGATGAGDGLFMIEPYQPGKIPVIFIHGLLSDPAVWTDLVNELRSQPDLTAGFQWWGFQYSTGEPFLTSAAVLRRQLREIRTTYDPQRQDKAFSQIVLVGHSMGGIVAKLQVTSSGDELWNASTQIPLTALTTSNDTRRALQAAFYFQPSMDVRRVIFIGTPHQGSDWARRPVGRLGSMLVEPSAATQSRHAQLIRDNPGVFGAELRQRFPTSVDLLKPDSALLHSTARIPYAPWVTLHSIVGTGKSMRSGEPGDGVVPVGSARLLGVASELAVNSTHASLHRAPPAIAEVMRILRTHRQASEAL